MIAGFGAGIPKHSNLYLWVPHAQVPYDADRNPS